MAPSSSQPGRTPSRLPKVYPRWLNAAEAGGRLIINLAVTLFGLVLITFLLARVMPIDPVLVLVGDRATPEVYARARESMGLDQPLYRQFADYLGNLLTGDLGQSAMTGKEVLADALRVLPATLELAIAGTLLGVGIGVPLGVFASVRRGRMVDHLIRLVSLVGYSVPIFWLGLVALLVFYARLNWVDGPGRIDVAYQYTIPHKTGFVLIDALLAGEWSAARNTLSHLILPASILGYFSMAYIARMTRSLMIGQLSQEYILAARAKGVPPRHVIWTHAFGNIAVPLVTIISLTFATLLEGAVLTETVFAWPGLGLYITQALFAADLNAVLGGTLVVGILFIAVNRCADLLYLVLDPRTR
jgi:peptide/nickel transport system permease protein